MVGERGFEPPTLWSQTRCAARLRYSPKLIDYYELVPSPTKISKNKLKKQDKTIH